MFLYGSTRQAYKKYNSLCNEKREHYTLEDHQLAVGFMKAMFQDQDHIFLLISFVSSLVFINFLKYYKFKMPIFKKILLFYNFMIYILKILLLFSGTFFGFIKYNTEFTSFFVDSISSQMINIFFIFIQISFIDRKLISGLIIKNFIRTLVNKVHYLILGSLTVFYIIARFRYFTNNFALFVISIICSIIVVSLYIYYLYIFYKQLYLKNDDEKIDIKKI